MYCVLSGFGGWLLRLVWCVGSMCLVVHVLRLLPVFWLPGFRFPVGWYNTSLYCGCFGLLVLIGGLIWCMVLGYCGAVCGWFWLIGSVGFVAILVGCFWWFRIAVWVDLMVSGFLCVWLWLL